MTAKVSRRFKVALSFPGEHRAYVKQVADCLIAELGQKRVFYDNSFEAELAKPNLDILLQKIYHDDSELVAVFFCAEYEKKEWCGLEWQAVRDLIKKKQDDSIMFLRFDDAEITGLLSIHGYVSIRNRPAQDIANLILERINGKKPVAKKHVVIAPNNLRERNAKFVGREKELDDIHAMLCDSARLVGVTQQAAAHGFGGVGKTSVALEYAWRHLERGDYPGGIFWISGDRDALIPQFASLAPHLGIKGERDEREIAADVKRRLESGDTALIVVDNLDDPKRWRLDEWHKWLPAGNCRRLITTREARLRDVKMYPVQRMPRDEGVKLLAEFRADAALKENADIAGSIVDWFDGLAVGLVVAGAYMAKHDDLSWAAYRDDLNAKKLGAVRATEDDVREDRPADYDERVEEVFDDLRASLNDVHRRALDYAALLPADNIVSHWLEFLLEHDSDIKLAAPPGYDKHPARPVVEDLRKSGLLTLVDAEAQTLGLHRLLRHHSNEKLNDASSKSVTEKLWKVIGELAEARGKKSHEAITDKSLRPELPPLAALVQGLRGAGKIKSAASLGNWIFTPLIDLGRYGEARDLLLPFTDEAARPAIGDAEFTTALSNLAVISRRLGELPKAREFMERVITIKEKNFVPGHPTLAISYSNLAMILHDLGELPKAREFMERAIAMDEKNFVPGHPNLAIRYSNLAMILIGLGELPKARELMERAIQIEEKNFEPMHPTLATSYLNLATILLVEGRREEAVAQLKRAYEIWTGHFGPEHPHVKSVTETLEYLGVKV